jgi:hypothetical protein
MDINKEGRGIVKKYIVFSLSFISIFVIVQWFSGMLLTMLYTPDPSLWKEAEHFPTKVQFVGPTHFPSLICLLFLFVISFLITKLFQKRFSHSHRD